MRIGVDIGGTFTDVVVFDEANDSIRLAKALSTPQELARGVQGALLKAGRAAVSGIDPASTARPSWSTRSSSARRQNGADHDQGLPRRLRDRAHQPAGVVQPALPQAPAAGAARADLRSAGAHAGRRHRATAARRRRRRARLPQILQDEGIEAVAVLFLHSYRWPAARAARWRDPAAGPNPRLFVTPRTSSRANIASTSAPRPWPPTPTSGRIVSRYLERPGAAPATTAVSRADLLIMQSNGGLSDVALARGSAFR